MDIKSISKPIGNFFARFHAILFVVFAFGGLAVAILVLNNTVQKSDQDNGYVSEVNSTSFDQATIDRVKELKGSNEETEKLTFPDRANPMAE